jgi:hypothetical protein
MGNLGKLNIVISAVNKTKGVFSGLNQDLKKITKVTGATTAILGKLTFAFAGLVAPIALFTKKSFDYIDAIGKTASRTGIATDTLQAFQLSAIESGTSIEQAQKGLEKFARSIGDAIRGTKTQVDLFDDLGVSLKDTNGNTRDFNDILRDTAEGIGGFSSESERATALANLFGRAGIQFTEIFKNGAEGLDALVKRARDLGIILDEKTIRATEKFNDTMSVVTFQFRAVRDNITTAFIPVLQSLASQLSLTIQDFQKTDDGVNKFGIRLNGSQKFILNFVESIGFLISSTIAFGQSIDTVISPFTNILKGIEIQFNKVGSIGHQVLNSLTFGFKGSLEEANRLTEQAKRLEEQLNEPDTEKSFLTSLSKITNDLRDNLIKGTITTEEFVKEMEKFGQASTTTLTSIASPLDQFIKKIGDTRLQLENLAIGTMKKFEDAIVDGLMSGKLAFKDFANFVIKELLRIAVKKLIIDKITGGFTSFLDVLSPKKKERGGTVTANRPYLVGEAGAELFVPNKTGTIVPNNRLGGGMGSGGMPVNITYNIQAFDSRDTLQAITENAPTISAIIESEFNNRGRRGFVT